MKHPAEMMDRPIHTPKCSETPYFGIPARAAIKIRDFLVDKRTGNIKLNIKDGRVLGIRVEEVESLKS